MRVTIHRHVDVLSGGRSPRSISYRRHSLRVAPPFARNLTLKMISHIQYGARCKRYKDIEIQAEERLYRPFYNDHSKPPGRSLSQNPFYGRITLAAPASSPNRFVAVENISVLDILNRCSRRESELCNRTDWRGSASNVTLKTSSRA